MNDKSGGAKPHLSFDMSSRFTHQSLITLEFVADTISFVETK